MREARLQRTGKTISSGRPLRNEEMPTFYDYVQCLDKCSTNWQLGVPAPLMVSPYSLLQSVPSLCYLNRAKFHHYIVDFSHTKIRPKTRLEKINIRYGIMSACGTTTYTLEPVRVFAWDLKQVACRAMWRSIWCVFAHPTPFVFGWIIGDWHPLFPSGDSLSTLRFLRVAS